MIKVNVKNVLINVWLVMIEIYPHPRILTLIHQVHGSKNIVEYVIKHSHLH